MKTEQGMKGHFFTLHAGKSQTSKGGHTDRVCMYARDFVCAFFKSSAKAFVMLGNLTGPCKNKPCSDHPWISSIVIHGPLPVATLCNPSSH